MCGIAGYIARQGKLLRNSLISRMTDFVRHRGPDDEGFLFVCNKTIITAGGPDTFPDVWNMARSYSPAARVNECSEGFSELVFGHRHLSLRDFSSSGHQPMSYADGRYWIVFDGRIHNYQEIRSALIELGHLFQTESDTETILASYVEWGENCLDRFVGMWSFIIFDNERNEVFISRDRYGIKPFYYYFTDRGDFYFASEIKQFTVLDEWKPLINPRRAYDQLVYAFTDHTDETMFRGVFQIPGGTLFRSSLAALKPDRDGRLLTRRWYMVQYEPFKGPFTEACNIFRELFEKAVSDHFPSDIMTGISLSGGLDSSAIVCEVDRISRTKLLQMPLRTFSSSTVHKKYSEKTWMDIIIRHTNPDAYFVYPDPNDIFRMTGDLIWIHDEPYQSQATFLGYHVYGLAGKNGIKVLLNGQGADEYLGGYGQFSSVRYLNMLRRLKFRSVLKDIETHCRYYEISQFSVFKEITKQILPAPVEKLLRKYKNNVREIEKLIDFKSLDLKPTHPFDDIPVKPGSVPEVSVIHTFYSPLPKYLRWEDRNSMANSIETRPPFLDHRLVEFTHSLPDDYLKKGGITKRVMREALKGLLPEEIRLRKDKVGFISPEEIWVKQEFSKKFRNKMETAVELTGGLIKPEVLDYFDKIVAGRIPFDYTYWRIILFSEWMQKFGVGI